MLGAHREYYASITWTGMCAALAVARRSVWSSSSLVAEVKNGRDLRYPLLEMTKELLDVYLARIRPSWQGSHEPVASFRVKAKARRVPRSQPADRRLDEEIVGFRITAHQFAHIMGTLHYSPVGERRGRRSPGR